VNIKRMHIGVQLEVQKIASNLNDDLLPQEIDYYLNESIEDYVEQQYNAIKTESRSIESQYVNDNIRTILTTAEIDSLSAVDYIPNSLRGDLPNDYRYYIFSRTYNGSKWINNRKLESKAIKKYIQTKTNLPIFTEFPLLIEGSKLIVIGDSREDLPDSSKIRLTYVKNPTVVEFPNSDSDLPDHTHKDIIKITAQKILQSLNVGQE
jgi:hypothetical protein